MFTIVLLLATIFSVVLSEYTLVFILVVFLLYHGFQTDKRLNEIQTKLGLK